MDTVIVPPIKCQGIKTKIGPFIKQTVKMDPEGTLIEPFLGSGVVLFNVAPRKAIVSDKNRYIIAFYRGIQRGEITPVVVRDFLEYHGERLSKGGADYWKEVRKEFNQNKDPLYFLFLNRSDFNGMIRFNRKGEFNVPFCRKPDRFAKAYVTKICNQVAKVSEIIKDKDWEFSNCDWQTTMKRATQKDYVYLDPPYIGRDTSYVGEWPQSEADELADLAHSTEANVCLSMWKENEFRFNDHLKDKWSDFTWLEQEHFYHIGAKESNRHPMIEVLAVKRI